MEYMREEAPHRSALERIQDYEPYLLPCSEEHIHTQSARCMNCGVPFCHAGIQVAGSSVGCPLGTLIPEVNDLVYRGDWSEAFRRLVLHHPFPEFTGRVCPALCEGSCVEGNFSSAVTVKDIERTLATHGFSHGLLPENSIRSTGKTVGIVGSGPAGLAAAHVLSLGGHRVRVYEKDDRPGGLLMYGIPNMKLEKSIIEERVLLLRNQGVEFYLNCEVGKDLTIAQLTEEHNAIILCIGAREQRRIQVPGCTSQGVNPALEYLTAATKHIVDGTPVDEHLTAYDKEVIVLGGGDTSVDCVATAIRQGALNITVLKTSPALPAQRAPENPWPLWPEVATVEYGLEEAHACFGREIREYDTVVKEILHQDGQCVGLVSAQVSWQRDKTTGRLISKELPHTTVTRKADLVLIAKGFVGVETALPSKLQLTLTSQGTIDTLGTEASDKERFATQLPGVFAAGDARRGPTLVVWAIQEGIQAAHECDSYLRR